MSIRLVDVTDLPPTLTTDQAAAVWGVGVDHLWALARSGQAPVEPLRLGRKLVWPTASVLRSIGLDLEHENATSAATTMPLRRSVGT